MTEPLAVVVTGALPLVRCYHCDEAIVEGSVKLEVRGAVREFCCAGCAAATELIVSLGLNHYYLQREAHAGRPATAEARGSLLASFDDNRLAGHCITPCENGELGVRLVLEGLRCAACAWLIEQRLARHPGITQARVDFAQSQASVRWDPRRLPLSEVLEAVWQLGYRAWPFDAVRQQEGLARARRDCLRRFGIAALCGMQVMMVASAFYFDAAGVQDAEYARMMDLLNLATTLPIVTWAAWPFHLGAWRALRHWMPSMDLPVSLGILLAFIGSTWHLVTGAGPTYYDSVAMFVTILLGARFLELSGQHRTAARLEQFQRIQPVVVRQLVEQDGVAVEQPMLVQSLQPGARIRVLPGELIAADGVVRLGVSTVDEQILSGESAPVPKQPGQRVLEGSVNVESPLEIEVTALGRQAFAGRMAELVLTAASARPRAAQRAATIATWFTAAVLVLAAATGLGRAFLFGLPWLPATVAVLVISCPCALALATPAALVAATEGLLGAGVALLRGGALETLARVTHVVFDKTGTLTEGRPALARIETFGGLDADTALNLAASLAAHSEHPLARAVVAAGAVDARHGFTDLRSLPGAGLTARLDEVPLLLGSRRFLAAQGVALPPMDDGHARQEVWLARGGAAQAVFFFEDRLRDDAAGVVSALQSAGMEVLVFSGDRAAVVADVAAALGIREAHGELRAEDKWSRLARLQEEGAVVAVVGEGVNDAPMLAGAAVSFAMANATDQARLAADFTLLREGLTPVVQAWELAQRTRRILNQNLLWALGYNVLAVPAAMLGWVTPWLAALCMSLSSLAVTVNAQRLRRR